MKIYNKNDIEELAKILRNDGVISVPTDTVYGVCAKMDSKKAYNKLVSTKNRPINKPFPVMCADEKQIETIAIVDDKAKKLINAFMPGPITLVLKKRQNVPDYVSNGLNTIAIRMATSKPLEELINKVGCPIFMSSANQSGEPTCTNLDEIEKACPNLDGMMEGKVSFGMASTIVDCTSVNVKVLRQGPITEEQIRKVLDEKSNGD